MFSKPLTYDIIIAGGGPAGSTAGYLLSKSGLKVLIIDKASFPRKKLCAGLITHKTVKLLERVFGESVSSLKEHDIINYESFRYEIFSRNKLINRRDIAIPFRFIDREHYDHFLLNKAKEAGTDVIEGDGVAVRSLNVLKNTISTESGRTFSADIFIGADGVNSRIRRSFLVDLFGREDWSGGLAAAHEVFVDRDSMKTQFEHPVLFFGYIEDGYAWIFPNRDRLKIGMCGLNKGNRKDILKAFRGFLSEMMAGGSHEAKIHSYVLPYGSFLPSPFFKNVMLVGDAAGFADPFIGEGVFFAQRSAELASQAIVEAYQSRGTISAHIQKQITGRYLQLLKTHIYTELEYAGKIRDSIFNRLNRFDYLPLKILMNIFGNMPVETIHGIRSYRYMKKLPVLTDNHEKQAAAGKGQ
jgi:geranylgeranyl reductase family protein